MDKPTLINKIKSLDGLSNDEKADLIQLLNETKQYGLVWEDKPEDVERDLLTMLPVLCEVPEKRILASEIVQEEVHKVEVEKSETLTGTMSMFPIVTNLEDELSLSVKKQSAAPNHILIEGDNLHALLALIFTHEGKIDLMYFDPPYNTGNKDFKYNDSFVDREDSFRHSKWLSFMHKRLVIAHRLLSDKGVIFISIDDNEQAQLKMLCDEIFLIENFVTSFIWRTDGNFDNQAQVKNCHEYILCYSKNASTFKVNSVIDPNVPEASKLFRENIQNTIVKNGPKNPMSEVFIPAGFPTLFETGSISARTNRFPHYLEDVLVNNFMTCNKTTVKSGWSSRTLLDLFIRNEFNPVIDSKNQLTEFKISESGSIEAIKVRADQSHIISVLMNLGNTQNNSNRLAEMGIKFSYPKPQSLLEYIISIYPNKYCSILDIFAGSGTTLHATMALNIDDGGTRQCILATNNENNICEEVTYERNRLVIQGYTNTKGVKVPGLTNNNLRYYKTAFVSREKTTKNKKQLTLLATELLCIKEDIYTELTQINDFIFDSKTVRCFSDKGRFLLVIYNEEIIEQLVPVIANINSSSKVKVYVFAPGQYPFTEEFEEVLHKIELGALPDAIYKAYMAVLPKKSDRRFAEAANTESEVVTSTEETEADLFTENTAGL
jgi:adenine-specific DNA-methyltransferase